MFELLEKDLKAAGIEFYKITGQTPKEERIKPVHAFNENEVPLFLISLKAGGTGLNLTGADVVIHYDPWWNLADAILSGESESLMNLFKEQLIELLGENIMNPSIKLLFHRWIYFLK